MAITNLKVSNFKSFKDLDLNLGRFNVVVGANAAGKSNFVEIFRFLRTLEHEGLNDAISLHGGVNSILNVRLGSSEPLRMCATSDRQLTWPGWLGSTPVRQTTYDFTLQLRDHGDGVLIKDDHFTQTFWGPIGDERLEVALDILVSDGKRRFEINPPDALERVKEKGTDLDFLSLQGGYDRIHTASWLFEAAPINALLIDQAFLGLLGPFDTLFGGVGVYDIDPHAIKRPHETAGIPRLEENGENLALVLKQILADPERSRKFHNLLRDILPFAVEIGTEQYLGTSILLKLRESYYNDALLANLLSDGTVDAAALTTALYFGDMDVVIIEEPERNIHPRLVSGLVEMMKDASRNKQIIVTTHSPEVVKHAGLENLLLISRDQDGFSTISRPAEKEAVKIFLEHDLGLDDLFVQDLLAVP